MSVMYCNHCDKYVDTDENVEHFMECKYCSEQVCEHDMWDDDICNECK